MGGTLAVAIPADRRHRMDATERANAIEERLRGQFLAALAGDAASYRQFLAALSAHLRAFLRRRMQRWPDDVEDLVQETLLAVHDSRHTYRSAQPFTAWVHTIARYKLVDYLRARSRREELNDPLDEELEIFARSDTDAAEARRDLAQMLAVLPERQRRVLVMVKLAGASVAEAARETGQSEVAVKVGVHRSLKALAARFRSGT
jgi:RNA polymerase sigma-70 factor (ECF subfamily)